MEPVKILFIGGTGNLSAECAALLETLGHEIVVLSRGRDAVPAQYRALVADRKDQGSMRTALEGLKPDVVLNFLGYELADVQLDHELLKGRLGQYVFISSASVYTKPLRQLPITESAPVGNPIWDYAQKKCDCERWLRERWQTEAFPLTIVRPTHTYSKRWIPNGVSSASYTFAARMEQGKPVFVHDNGESPWTLTAASDFAAGLAGLLGRTDVLGETFHITSDEALSWNEIYAEIAAALGVAAPQVVKVPTDFICQVAPRLTGTLKGDKAHPGVFDNSKIKRCVPGFECRKPFQVGVRESVQWLREHPERQNRDPQLDALIEQVITSYAHRA
jgi:nucleoside-diphosphate-sugar epimerase